MDTNFLLAVCTVSSFVILMSSFVFFAARLRGAASSTATYLKVGLATVVFTLVWFGTGALLLYPSVLGEMGPGGGNAQEHIDDRMHALTFPYGIQTLGAPLIFFCLAVLLLFVKSHYQRYYLATIIFVNGSYFAFLVAGSGSLDFSNELFGCIAGIAIFGVLTGVLAELSSSSDKELPIAQEPLRHRSSIYVALIWVFLGEGFVVLGILTGTIYGQVLTSAWTSSTLNPGSAFTGDLTDISIIACAGIVAEVLAFILLHFRAVLVTLLRKEYGPSPD